MASKNIQMVTCTGWWESKEKDGNLEDKVTKGKKCKEAKIETKTKGCGKEIISYGHEMCGGYVKRSEIGIKWASMK